MQITLTLDLTEDNLDKLKVFCEEVKALTKTAKKSTKKQTKVESVVEPATEIAESEISEEKTESTVENTEPEPTEKKAAVTKTDVRAVALKISKAGKSDALREIFGKFGATNLKGIAEGDYEALMRELVAVNV